MPPPAFVDGCRPKAEGVVVELAPEQIDQVVREASGTGNMAFLMSGLAAVRDELEATPSHLTDSRLSRSLLAGLRVLSAFPADGTSLGNLEISQMLKMRTSTVHRYLTTLLALGLLERNTHTRRYRLAQ